MSKNALKPKTVWKIEKRQNKNFEFGNVWSEYYWFGEQKKKKIQ